LSVRREELLSLPADLPVPVDDGECDHLPGLVVPSAVLESTQGPIDLADLFSGLGVLFVYPRAGLPGQPTPTGWDAIPGARGCTPQACAYRDLHGELVGRGARVAGVSTQTLADQHTFAKLRELPFPVLADPHVRLAEVLKLPTFDVDGLTLYRRAALVGESGTIVKVFYPVFPPDRNAADVLAWLETRG
jgi:peroxiredoxin